MTTAEEIACPRCREVRLVDTILDKRGRRYYCQVCAHEFAEGSERSPKT
jgi:transcription elongation factor Elf1